MRGKRTSDDLAKSIYPFKEANPDYANSAIAWNFSISESTLRGILKRRIGQKKWGQKSVLTRRIKRQLLGRVIRSTKLRLSDHLHTARRLVSNATVHRFFEKLRHSKLCCYTRRSNECSKREESWLAPSTYIFWFHKWYFQRRLNSSSLVNFLKRSIDSTELIMKRSKGPCLIK